MQGHVVDVEEQPRRKCVEGHLRVRCGDLVIVDAGGRLVVGHDDVAVAFLNEIEGAQEALGELFSGERVHQRHHELVFNGKDMRRLVPGGHEGLQHGGGLRFE